MRLNVDLLHKGKFFRAFEDEIPNSIPAAIARRYAANNGVVEAEPAEPLAVLRARRKLERQKRVQ
jgi:hypothetical protein